MDQPLRRYPPPRGDVHPDQSLGWLRRLLPIVLAHRLVFFGTLGFALIANLLQVALPAVLRTGIDRALADGALADAVLADGALAEQAEPLGRYVWLVLAVGLSRAALTLVYRYGLYRTAFQIDSDLRNRLYEHLTRLSFNYYDRVQSGQIISRANSDIRSVQLFLTFAPLMLMTLVMFVVALAYMFSINVWLTLVAVLPLPGVYWLGVRLRNELFPLSWIVQGRQAEVATIVDENIQGVRVIRSFAAERRQIDELAKAATGLHWANLRAVDMRARHNPIIENLPRIGTLLVLVYGGRLVVEGQVTPGTLFAFTAYVTMLQAPFRMFGFFLMMGQRARASAARIFEILDEPAEIVDRADAADLDRPRGEVEFDDVSFGYSSGGSVLRGLSFRVEPGETIAIVGRTGSGKSTIARLLARFYEVDGGAIRLDGHDLRDLTLRSVRSAVGSVADEPFLFSISLADNIAYARPGADRHELESAARVAVAHDFIAALPEGYDTIVGERGYTLSGGQRQRIAIARTLLSEPAVLVLDDATSAIDVHVEERIHEALRSRLGRCTTLVIAHRLSTIALADRVVLIDEGRIAASGTHLELMATEPRYAEVLEAASV